MFLDIANIFFDILDIRWVTVFKNGRPDGGRPLQIF